MYSELYTYTTSSLRLNYIPVRLECIKCTQISDVKRRQEHWNIVDTHDY